MVKMPMGTREAQESSVVILLNRLSWVFLRLIGAEYGTRGKDFQSVLKSNSPHQGSLKQLNGWGICNDSLTCWKVAVIKRVMHAERRTPALMHAAPAYPDGEVVKLSLPIINIEVEMVGGFITR